VNDCGADEGACGVFVAGDVVAVGGAAVAGAGTAVDVDGARVGAGWLGVETSTRGADDDAQAVMIEAQHNTQMSRNFMAPRNYRLPKSV